jgi:hypothetical protein
VLLEQLLAFLRQHKVREQHRGVRVRRVAGDADGIGPAEGRR